MYKHLDLAPLVKPFTLCVTFLSLACDSSGLLLDPHSPLASSSLCAVWMEVERRGRQHGVGTQVSGAPGVRQEGERGGGTGGGRATPGQRGERLLEPTAGYRERGR